MAPSVYYYTACRTGIWFQPWYFAVFSVECILVNSRKISSVRALHFFLVKGISIEKFFWVRCNQSILISDPLLFCTVFVSCHRHFKSDFTEDRREKMKTQNLLCYVTKYIKINHESSWASAFLATCNWSWRQCIGNRVGKFHNVEFKKPSQFDECSWEKRKTENVLRVILTSQSASR